MSATLGGLIKDYRIQKNISQIEIAFALGWKEPSRLSRIEQGKVKNPSREMLDLLARALKLDEKEKNNMLLIGGYLPTDHEIEEFRKTIQIVLEKFPYPASVRDFSWRIIYVNQKFSHLFNFGDDFMQKVYGNNLWKLEVMFTSHSSTINDQNSPERRHFLAMTLAHFYHTQRKHSNEKWYQDLLKKLMNIPLFRELWIEIQAMPTKETTFIENFAEKDFFQTSDGQKIHLYYFALPAFNDPRFLVEMHVPADRVTLDYLMAFLQ